MIILDFVVLGILSTEQMNSLRLREVRSLHFEIIDCGTHRRGTVNRTRLRRCPNARPDLRVILYPYNPPDHLPAKYRAS